jgi:hypothetical protein
MRGLSRTKPKKMFKLRQEQNLRPANMPPLRGLRVLVPGHYKEVAPAALGRRPQHVGLKFGMKIRRGFPVK